MFDEFDRLNMCLICPNLFGSNIENPLSYGEEFDEVGEEDTDDDNDVMELQKDWTFEEIS
ncbi:hypothetical protein MTR_1g094815 [Medicago truncatula]|uniref:Uncharacterized protein n=1 Tax=Medicago truncatula TaxID=3880 RepID=A0A072VNC9_MEDTR|nr:hypothetical protein MTR_1g094815 [Medicago truncatula]